MVSLLCDGADMEVLERQLCRMLHDVRCSKFNEHILRQKHYELIKNTFLTQPVALCTIYLSDIEKQLHLFSLFQYLLQKVHCQ